MRVRQQTSTTRRNHGQVYVSEVYYYANLIFQFVYQVNSEVVDIDLHGFPGLINVLLLALLISYYWPS